MPDSLTRLREADPAAHAETPQPPDDVLRAILATPPERKRRRAPRIVLAGAALAAAAVVAIAALPDEHRPARPRRSARASPSAPTRPRVPQPDFITYTETTTVQTGPPKLESYDKLRQWQYQDRMHNVMDTRQSRGTWVYEHDQNGGTFRTLMHNNKGGKDFQVTHKTDPGWDPEELEQGFKVGVTTLVDRFREQIAGAKDLGETTFNGKPAHAYSVAADAKKRIVGPTTYYVDPQTAYPLGQHGVLRDDESRSPRPSTATSSSRPRRRTWPTSTRRTSTRRPKSR